MTRDCFAEAFAAADAETQAAFLNRFVQTLTALCKAHPTGSATMQAFYIAERLTVETVVFLKDVVETHDHLQTEYSPEQLQRRMDRIRALDEEIRQKEELRDGV